MTEFVEIGMSIGNDKAAFFMSSFGGMDNIVTQCLRAGLTYYELPLPTVLMALAQEARGVFLDIGANTGLYSFLATAANPRLRSFSFEPVPDVRRLMEQNMTANSDLSKRILISPFALSGVSGRGIIHQHVNPFGLVPTSSSLEVMSSSALSSVDIPIDVTTLDSWAESCILVESELDKGLTSSIDFVKIDVEGHEHQTFIGAREVISKSRPLIVVELLGDAQFDYFANFLSEAVYVDIALFPGEAKRLDSPRFEQDAWNHLLCPMEKVWSFARTCQRIGLPLA